MLKLCSATNFSGGASPDAEILMLERLVPGSVRFISEVRMILAATGCAAALALVSVPASANPLHAAVLPSEAPHFSFSEDTRRSPAFFATLINDSDGLLQNCRIEMAVDLPFILDYQVTERVQNRAVGPANTSAVIGPRSSQSFRFSLRLREDVSVPQQKLGFRFVCDGATPAAIVEDINTVLLSAGTPSAPGLLSAVAVASADGVLQLNATPNGPASPCRLIPYPGAAIVPCAIGAYAFALINTEPVARQLEVLETSGMHFTQLCRTDSAGVCTDTADPQFPLEITLEAGELATFSAYLVTLDDFAFNPFVDFQSAGIEVYEVTGAGANPLLLEERIRAEAEAFEWLAQVDTENGVDVLRVQGSLWVGSGCSQAVLTPAIDSQVPANELHLQLASATRRLPPLTPCLQAINKSNVAYQSDFPIDGITKVVIRHPLRRLELDLER